ncbi:amino acid permease [Paeniglutamicibacter sp. ANT13_2]|uniref:Amino acid permease n=1 Tax=Paeniglutamicibacter terrestris TaxID=2723403 RepID=A0ABX1G6V6_9MICC|nr:amino acid permease [Paeniglutamicibacter terrestris]
MLSVMLTFLLGVTHLWFSMSRDGLLPGWFAKTDRHGTGQRVTRIAGIASAFLAGAFPIEAVADLTNIGILAAFVVACLAVIIFRLHFMPVIPAFGLLASGFLMLQLLWETWLRFAVWLVVSLAIYFLLRPQASLMIPDSPRYDDGMVFLHWTN